MSARATTIAKLSPTYGGHGRWVIDLGSGGRRNAIISSTPGATGYRIQFGPGRSNILLLQEDFDDGTQYTIYSEKNTHLRKLYKLDNMVSYWKILPDDKIIDDSLLFLDSSSDYILLKEITDSRLFTIVSNSSKEHKFVAMKCRYLHYKKYRNSREFNSDTMSDSAKYLIDGISNRSELSCHIPNTPHSSRP